MNRALGAPGHRRGRGVAAPAGSARSGGGRPGCPARQRRVRGGHRARAGGRRLPGAGAPAPAAHAGDRLRHAPPRCGGRDHDHGEPQPAAGQRLQALPRRRRPDRPAGRRGDLRADRRGRLGLGPAVVGGRRRGRSATTWSTPTSTERSACSTTGPGSVEVVYTAMHGVGAETVRAAFARAGFPAAPRGARAGGAGPRLPDGRRSRTRRSPARSTSRWPSRAPPAPTSCWPTIPTPTASGWRSRTPSAEGGWRALTGDEIGSVLADHLLRTGRYGPDDVVATTVVSSRLLSKLAARGRRRVRRSAHRVQVGGPHARARSTVRLRLRGGAGLLRGRARPRQGRHHRGARGRRPRRPPARRGLVAGRPPRRARPAARRPRHAPAVHPRRAEATGSPGSPPPWPPCGRRRPSSWPGGRWSASKTWPWPIASRCPSDVLVWTLDGARAIVRPSGTEPKLKCYAEAVVPVGDEPVAAARQQASAIVDEVLDDVAARLRGHGL